MKTLHLRLAAGLAGRLTDIAALQRDPALLEAARILRAGGLVAFPTETVYGLGANALAAAAVEKIFAAKRRPHWDPVIVHVADVEGARRLTLRWPEAAERLAEAFWPGPLTMLLPRNERIPKVCTAGLEKVGIRLPSHPVARALIALAGVPVAAPSANLFGHTSPTSAGHVLADLDGRIDAILDAGSSPVGVESTVLDPTTDPVIVYRPGGVTAEQIGQLLGGVRVAERKPVAGSPDDGSEDVASEAAREGQESPGLSLRHYAPRARLVLVATQAELVEVLLRETSFNEDQGQGVRVGVLLPGGWTLPADWPIKTGAATVTIVPWGSWSQPELLARELYGQMRALDEQGVDLIVCPMPAAEGIGLAIRDRLLKAAQ